MQEVHRSHDIVRAAFNSSLVELAQLRSGNEPILGGSLHAKAVWVDELACIGCGYCTNVASNTFMMLSHSGRCRALRQDGDSLMLIQEAIDTCPVDCIHWVDFSELRSLLPGQSAVVTNRCTHQWPA
ncbi:ferredoxin [Synechococcus sp. UW140]|uniref:ferredoxin n=1 Tax=Synechococcus sp. UW140 TaxID=368503 RepID=UPI000E0E4108|nr:ferredoxin [Synechococcus sp. UW140]